MEIMHFNTSPLQTNTYVVLNNGGAFVVDPGSDADKIMYAIKAKKSKLEAILLTHAHFDHIGGVAELLKLAISDTDENYDESLLPKVFLHCDDADKVNSYKNLAFSMNLKVEKFTPDVLLRGGEKLNIAGVKVLVLHTPGHSKGGVCYIVGTKIFVGDTIFFMSYGRTDFYDGNFNELKNSIINKLFRLNGNYMLLPGHGEPTSLDFERHNNEILDEKVFDRIIE